MMMNGCDNRPIGIFDSGLGGLTVAAALRRKLPGESIVYLGDTARVPYGEKSVDAIVRFAGEDAAFMLSRGVKMIVVACNTVSAVALPSLRGAHPGERILGVIESGAAAALASGAKRIAVIATRATIYSDAYRRALHALDPALQVESIACPLFVPLAEEGVVEGPALEAILDLYLGRLLAHPPEALLLGCTHYPLFTESLNRFFGGRVKIIDSASACAEAVTSYFQRNGGAAAPDNPSSFRCYVTDLPSEFTRQATRFLGRAPDRVERVTLA